MKKTLLFFLLISHISLFANSYNKLTDTIEVEDDVKPIEIDNDKGPRSVLKINLTSFVLGNNAFQYEFSLTKKFSVALGANQLIISPFARNQIYAAINPKLPNPEGIGSLAINGWSITPEIRFYPNKKTHTIKPKGNYVALYYRYSDSQLKGQYTFEVSAPEGTIDTTTTIKTNLNFSHRGYSVGLMFGYQWLLGKHFSIDWWIIGAGRGAAKSDFKFTSESVLIPGFAQEMIETEVADIVKEAKLPGLEGDPEITVTPNMVELLLPKWRMFSVRAMGLCIGFTF